jgi:uncharacterized Zn-finger protein
VFRPQIGRVGLATSDPTGYGAALARASSAPVTRSALTPRLETRTKNMAERIVPHFHNTPGVAVIEIGAREFMCEGELAPFDHPHVFLDMGDATEIICPYCSTLFRYDPTLDPHAARPAECALADGATA